MGLSVPPSVRRECTLLLEVAEGFSPMGLGQRLQDANDRVAVEIALVVGRAFVEVL